MYQSSLDCKHTMAKLAVVALLSLFAFQVALAQPRLGTSDELVRLAKQARILLANAQYDVFVEANDMKFHVDNAATDAGDLMVAQVRRVSKNAWVVDEANDALDQVYPSAVENIDSIYEDALNSIAGIVNETDASISQLSQIANATEAHISELSEQLEPANKLVKSFLEKYRVSLRIVIHEYKFRLQEAVSAAKSSIDGSRDVVKVSNSISDTISKADHYSYEQLSYTDSDLGYKVRTLVLY